MRGATHLLDLAVQHEDVEQHLDVLDGEVRLRELRAAQRVTHAVRRRVLRCVRDRVERVLGARAALWEALRAVSGARAMAGDGGETHDVGDEPVARLGEVLDELGVELVVGVPRPAGERDRGLEALEHVDLARDVLRAVSM